MATNTAPTFDPMKNTFSAPVPNGEKFEVVVTDENGTEVFRKDGFDSKEEARQWSQDTVKNALTGDTTAKPAGKKVSGNSNLSL